MKSNPGIYKITNIKNNRYYIGSSVNINKRWLTHKRLLNKGEHENNFLQNSWDKHGEESFVFEVLEVVSELSNLLIREQYYLDLIKPFNKETTFNLCETAGNMLGFRHTNETKEKMSISQLNRFKDPKERVKCNIFKNLTEEEKLVLIEVMSKSHKGLKHSTDTKVKMIKLSLGRKHNSETKSKLSKINKGRKHNNKRKVYQLDTNNNIIKLWDSLTEAAEYFNIHPSRICSACNGRTKTCVGFKWDYLKPTQSNRISEDVKIKIKNMYKSGSYSTRELASIFNISKSAVWTIVNKN